jgi:Beta-glucosidase-related glycosidases
MLFRTSLLRVSVGRALVAAVALSVFTATGGDVRAQMAASVRTNDADADRFVDELLKKMTLEEKIGQMSQIALNSPEGPKRDERIVKGQVGSLLFVKDPKEIDRLQHLAMEKSRLHIPLIIGFDVIHGYRTIYPVPIAMAASWDPAAAEKAQRMAAREASAVGVRWTFGPMLDIARDPRWGRMMEGAGEDPYLGARMAEAQVRGFQGKDVNHIADDHIMACIKHFAGYGAAEGGRDYDSSNISDEQLWNVYLPPFEAAVKAGAGSLMSAYMDLNGVPATGNKWLLTDVLRKKWGFNGFVVSDWDSVKSLATHGFATGPEDAAVRAVNAGVDLEMTSTTFFDTLADAVKKGEVTQAKIDAAVRDILMAKYRLGLFKQPYVSAGRAENELVSAEQREASRKIAEKTAVLLRNEGGLLPLKKGLTSIAVIGPLADSKPDIMGSWSLAAHPEDTVTVVEALTKRTAAGGPQVLFTKGVEIERVQPSIFDDQFPSPKPTLTTESAKEAEFNRAIDLVKRADAAVLVLGEAQTMSGERASRSSLTLPGKQQQLVEAAVATGKPVVLLLVNARPLDITWASQHVPAILDAWYPGTEAGNAIADLLFGDAVPGGKLPVTWPRDVGQVPIHYARNLTQIPNDWDTMYWDGSSAPLYPFGYGLSYTSFTVGGLKTSSEKVAAGGAIEVSVDVANTGKVAGDEVVQLYTHQRAGSASRPVRELKGFKRVTLKAGERQTVTLKLETKELGFWSPQTHAWGIEPGTFDLWVGTDSNAKDHATFEVTPSK